MHETIRSGLNIDQVSSDSTVYDECQQEYSILCSFYTEFGHVANSFMQFLSIAGNAPLIFRSTLAPYY